LVDLDALPQPQRSAVAQAVFLARQVVEDDRFREVLVSWNGLAAGDGTSVSGATVESQLLGRVRPSPVRSRYFLGGVNCPKRGTETARTGIELDVSAGATTDVDANGAASTCLQEDVVDRAKPDQREGSIACAINTIVHEWMHTIPDRPLRPEDRTPGFAFTDAGHKNAEGQLVSYGASHCNAQVGSDYLLTRRQRQIFAVAGCVVPSFPPRAKRTPRIEDHCQSREFRGGSTRIHGHQDLRC
jgi:hypothetical protein